MISLSLSLSLYLSYSFVYYTWMEVKFVIAPVNYWISKNNLLQPLLLLIVVCVFKSHHDTQKTHIYSILLCIPILGHLIYQHLYELHSTRISRYSISFYYIPCTVRITAGCKKIITCLGIYYTLYLFLTISNYL